jgi:YjbE family integral membrane protein
VGLITQHFDPALLRDWLEAGPAQLHSAAFWFAVLQIVFADLLLSGDNAVIIAMACRGLPQEQRRWGIVIGAGVAVILRVVFVGIIARLMLLPYLKLIGGVALLIIAARLIVPEESARREVQAAAQLWRAVMIIAVADIVMSLDNIVAIAAIAEGNILLLAIGLGLSIPLIMAGAALITGLLDRFPLLIWVGAALLGWVAGDVIATDPAIVAHLTAAFGARIADAVDLAAAAAAAFLAVVAGGLWWRLREAKQQAKAAHNETNDT